MSFAKYAQFYKENGFFAGSKIKATITDNSFIGQELVLTKGSSVIRSTTIPASGKVDFFTDESGELTLASNNGTSTISGTVEITNYGTYNVTLDGEASDTSRQVYASKNSVTLDATHSSDTVSISYTGDIASMSVNSSNTNVATARLNNNIVTITDAGKGIKGTSRVAVTIGATRKYKAKTFNINVTKTNGEIDKSWAGLKNIVEEGLEEELCEIGEEYTVSLPSGVEATYLIGCMNRDTSHQLIFVPKQYDYFGKYQMNPSAGNLNWGNMTLRQYFNTTLFDSFPSELKSVISSRTIQFAISNSALSETNDKLWLPREIEILGHTNNCFTKETEAANIGIFPCFQDGLITVGNSTSKTWTMSLSTHDNGNMCEVFLSSNTYATDWGYPSTQAHVLPCFHIIKDA